MQQALETDDRSLKECQVKEHKKQSPPGTLGPINLQLKLAFEWETLQNWDVTRSVI